MNCEARAVLTKHVGEFRSVHIFDYDMCHLMCNSDTGHDGHASGVDLNRVVSMENDPVLRTDASITTKLEMKCVALP
jgi:hypothetical protein